MATIFISVPLTLSFLFTLLLVLPLYILAQRISEKYPNTSSSGPTSYPILGCLVSFYKNRDRLLDWYTDMLSVSRSQTIIIARFGARRTIVTANPQNVKYILKTNFNNYPKGEPFRDILGDFLGNGIFNVDGDLWYKQRKLVVHHFKAKSLHEYVEGVLKEEVEKKLMPVLESAADEVEGKYVDLQDLLRRLAFDLVCQVTLGYDPCCLEYNSLDASHSHPIVEAFNVASDICARRGAAPVSAIWKVKRCLNIGSEKRLREAVSTIHLFINGIIRDKKQFESNLLSKMVVEGEEEEVIRDTMISLIMAGRDATSATMTWLFYQLSLHPEIENKVVKEISIHEDNHNMSKFEVLNEFKWLKACICESMRLFPPVAWNSKHAMGDDCLPDGTRVRAGDRVTYFPYGMGRMKGLWGEDRFEFKPERWVFEVEQGKIKALKNFGSYKFPVFQAGPRTCLGKEMAFVQMKYVVASILKRFIIRPVNTDRPVFVPLLTAHMAGGFKVVVRRRQ